MGSAVMGAMKKLGWSLFAALLLSMAMTAAAFAAEAPQDGRIQAGVASGMETQADADYTRFTLTIADEVVYQGYRDALDTSKLPSGVTFDKSTLTLTFQNANISNVVVGEYDSYIFGSCTGDEPIPLHINLVGNNTITCKDVGEGEDFESLISNGGTIVFEGSGTLTVKNCPGLLAKARWDSKGDIRVEGCTINCAGGTHGGQVFYCRNLVMNGCTVNMSFDPSMVDGYEDATEGGVLVELREGDLVMNKATFNIKTKADGTGPHVGIDDNSASMRIVHGEFKNSKLIVTGDYFKYIDFDDFAEGGLVFDNSIVKGLGRVSNAYYMDSQATIVFKNKHQLVNSENGDEYIIASGTYSINDNPLVGVGEWVEYNTFLWPDVVPLKTVDLAGAVVTLEKVSAAYTGAVQKGAVKSVVLGGKTLQADKEYTVSAKSGKAPGSYDVVVKGTGLYTGSITKKFVVKKAANPLKVSAKTATVEFSKLKKKAQQLDKSAVLTFTGKGQGKLSYIKSSGHKKIAVNKTTGKVTVGKGLKKKTYKVTVKVNAAGDANYEAATKTVTFAVKVK